MKRDRAALAGSWRHSHEEDTRDQMVFRDVGFAFPSSRGRVAFHLVEDGTGWFASPGRDDRGAQQVIYWELREKGDLAILDASRQRMLFHGVLAHQEPGLMRLQPMAS
jgi:hypothetical protein